MSPSKVKLWAAAFVLSCAAVTQANAQSVRYAIEPRASLAWWQMNPNFSHLWATTCPDDPSWQPGEGRSPGYYVDYYRVHKTAEAGVADTRIPLYPRSRIRYVCSQAVFGQFDVSDPTTWKVSGGKITIFPDSLITGLDMRDSYSRKQVFQTRQFPSIQFTIDSLANRQMVGDTLKALAVGTFDMHGVQKKMSVPLKAWPDGGGLRVQAQAEFPAKDLTREWQFNQNALGMGVTLGMWREVHFGVDVLMKKAAGTSTGSN